MYLVLFRLFCTLTSIKTHIKIPPNQKTNRVILEFSVQVPLNHQIYLVLINSSLERYQEHQLPGLLNDALCYLLQAKRMITEQSLKSRGPQITCTHDS